jgi:GNAT superfamily N-acetyltransferase
MTSLALVPALRSDSCQRGRAPGKVSLFETKVNSMRAKDPEAIELFADELDSWLRHRFHYRARLTHCGMSGTVRARRAKVDLYLRLITHSIKGVPWPANTLVIARIEFRERHKGHGRAFLRFLLAQAERFGYDKIAVECTSDDIGIQSFCAKFFFDQPTSPRRNSNWIAAVEHVSLVLAGGKTSPNLS